MLAIRGAGAAYCAGREGLDTDAANDSSTSMSSGLELFERYPTAPYWEAVSDSSGSMLSLVAITAEP